MITKILILVFGIIYLLSTFAFITLCYLHHDDWDMFQNKGEIVQFEEGNYLNGVTFHWFEIEFVAIPSKIVYYLISYYFFLKHRQNKKNIAAGVKKSLISKWSKTFCGTDQRQSEGEDKNPKYVKKETKKYFFDKKNSDSFAFSDDEESYDSMLYDEDNVNQLQDMRKLMENANNVVKRKNSYSGKKLGTKSNTFFSSVNDSPDYDHTMRMP